jgi:hypothetical protein
MKYILIIAILNSCITSNEEPKYKVACYTDKPFSPNSTNPKCPD